MKNLLTLVIFYLGFLGISQNIQRENINGKIIVEGNDIEGVTVYNSSSKKGTVTNENGEFIIAVALNDLLEIRALEYQNFDVKINRTILESQRISIFLIEEVNKLDEILVSSKGLTGNIKKDINNVRTFNPKLNAIYFGIESPSAQGFSSDDKNNIENVTIHSQAQPMVNGLNLVNVVDQLLIPLFRAEVKDKKITGVPEVPVKSIKYYFGSSYLVENFNIPEHRVEEFIRYVEDETFDFDLLNYGHELEFLELLNEKSKIFLNTKTIIDKKTKHQ
ncbi:hypothetical protein GCM10022393_16960 [Aquimarina addita]|uniref:Carboxypeptidase-like regulatory domain-containing protein n=1 Tax=Aquimarina addita TaxID=870485 RepID=A0ABP7XHY1_9FLAO